ncbi:MAG: glycosyltransferase [Caldilineaceae bacterium]|nr:glycosyltransferase [Caldilineaceae bacterium]
MSQESDLLCSVIVPVYNGEATILGCLKALSRQTLPIHRFEVIVVDDGSSDGTAAVVGAWIARHGLEKWQVVSQPNAGPAAARNHGAALTKSPLLLFTDADCTPSPGWVETMTAPFLGDDPPAGVMGAYLSQQSAPAARFAQYEFEERYALMARLSRIDLIATYAAAYDRKLFLQFGGFDASFPEANNEDVDFSFRLSKSGARMIFVPEATVTHPHLTTWGSYARTKMKRAYWRMQVYRRYPEKVVVDGYTPPSLKLQLLLGGIGLLGLLVAGGTGQWYGLIPLLLFLVAATPTALFMAARWPSFVLWAVWGIWLRSLAFTVGVVWGLLCPYPFTEADKSERPAVVPVSNE